MIQNCQQFERRIQHLMDCRIDPETDETLCAHSAICDDCHESLMAYSILHSNYLHDSDSMKIKLENLGLQEVFARRRPEPKQRHWLEMVVCLAAMITFLAVLTGPRLLDDNSSPAIAQNVTQDTSVAVDGQSVSFQSLVQVHESLDQNDLYQYSTELPGLRPLKALSYCLTWFHNSYFGLGSSQSDSAGQSDAGQSDLGTNTKAIERANIPFLKLAACG